MFGLLFPMYQLFMYVFIFTKNGLGYILGDFFTNSSGHPELLHQARYTPGKSSEAKIVPLMHQPLTYMYSVNKTLKSLQLARHHVQSISLYRTHKI
jgi:hypothetical protein